MLHYLDAFRTIDWVRAVKEMQYVSALANFIKTKPLTVSR